MNESCEEVSKEGVERLPAFDAEDGGNVILSRSRVTIEAFTDTGNCCFINVDVVVFIWFSINVLLDVGDCFLWTLPPPVCSCVTRKESGGSFWLCVTKTAEAGWLLSLIQLCLRDADSDVDLLLDVDHFFQCCFQSSCECCVQAVGWRCAEGLS